MLTPQEQERIKAEELYRLQVRAAYEQSNAAPPVPASRLSEFLNSALGLWLLSTVFVSVFSWGYTELTDRAKARAETERLHATLRQELAFRLTALGQGLAAATQAPDTGKVGQLDALRDAIDNGETALVHGCKKRGYLFKEYQDTSADQLLQQLDDLETANAQLPSRYAHLRADYTRMAARVDQLEQHWLAGPTDAPAADASAYAARP